MDKRFKFEKMEGGLKTAQVIVDTQTGVQYLFVAAGYAGGLTVLVDRDGKPLINYDEIK